MLYTVTALVNSISSAILDRLFLIEWIPSNRYTRFSPKKNHLRSGAIDASHFTRFAAACAIAITSTISRTAACAGAATAQPGAGPEHASSGRLPHNALFPDPDLSAHSFRESSTGRSIWWDRVFAFEDFLEMAVNLSTVSKWKKELDVLGEWLHYDEATVR